MWRATVKGLIAHKLRLALTALSVVLGVSFVTGTYVLTDTLGAFFDGAFAEATAGTDVLVQSAAGTDDDTPDALEPVDESVLTTVQGVDGVRVAEGMVGGFAQMVGRDGKPIGGQGPPTLGFSWGPTTELYPLTIHAGTKPDAPGEVAIDAATARKQHFGVGDRIKILFTGPAEEFTVSAIVGFGKSDNLGGATIAAFTLADAQRVVGQRGKYDQIGIVADDGASVDALVQRLEGALPDDIEARRGEEVAADEADQIKGQINFLGTALRFFAGIALFVGAFIIANTFSIIVAQRTKELALLRALGASGRQVLGSVLGEALAIGVAASIAGIGLGLLVGAGLRALFQTIAGGGNLPGASILLLPRTVVVGLVVGTGTTLVSAIAPARRASRLSPVAAMREDWSTAGEAGLSVLRLVGVAVALAAGGALLGRGLFGSDVALRFAIIGAGALLVFVGVALGSALVTRPLTGVIGAPMARIGGVAGRLARQNAARNPKRTAATAAALMVGLGMVSAITVMGSSIKTSLNKVIDEAFSADLTVTPKGNQEGVFSPEVAERVRKVEGVDQVVSLRFGTFQAEGRRRFLISPSERGLASVLDLDVQQGSVDALADGGVLLHEDIAGKRGLGVGDTLRMDLPTGPIDVNVDGIFRDRRVLDTSYLLSRRDYERGFTEQNDGVLLVDVAEGREVAAAGRQITKGLEDDFPNVQVRDQEAFKEEASANVNQILALVSALLLLAVIIALLGIANTLALSIFERTRELGLLRAVGMSRRQTRRMVRAESVIVAVLGAVLGIVVGVGFGILIVRALYDEGIRQLTVPAGQLVVLIVAAAVAGILAAIFPARRAARLDILQAIASD
ncbi:MAG TPA: ABC transporter permease [Acidimicrobiales bacterium]|nr:ABC transporter permease [Acidimicrobiales bacterium]